MVVSEVERVEVGLLTLRAHTLIISTCIVGSGPPRYADDLASLVLTGEQASVGITL
jgi:hypothetical protein